MLPLFPGDLLNVLAGVSGMPPRRFLAVNLLGHMPGTEVLTLVAALAGLAWSAHRLASPAEEPA